MSPQLPANPATEQRPIDPLRTTPNVREDPFRFLEESASDIIYRRRLLPDMAVEYMSPSVFAVLGYSPDEFYADPLLTLAIVHPDDRQKLTALWSGAEPPGMLRMIRRDGRVVYLDHRTHVVRDNAGRIVAIEGVARDMTAEKAAEAQRQLSDTILGSIGSLVLVCDAQGAITYANKPIERLLGYSPKDVLGDGWWRLAWAGGTAGTAERARLTTAAGDGLIDPQPYERPVRAADGSLRWMLWRDAVGPDGSIIGVGQDITERKHAEEERQGLLQDLGQRVSELTLLHRATRLLDDTQRSVRDTLQQIVDLLPSACQHPEIALARITYDGVEGRTPGFRTTPWAYTAEFISGEKHGLVEVAYTKPPPFGADRLFVPESRNLLSSLADMLAAHFERRRAELASAHSEAKYRALVESVPVVTYAVGLTAEGDVLYVSPQVETLTGYTPAELTGTAGRWHTIIEPEDRPEVLRRLADTCTKGTLFECEYRIRRKSGSIGWVRDEATVVRDDAGRTLCLQGVLFDITARRLAEGNARAEQAFRAAIERSMAAGVAAVDLDGRISYVNRAFTDMVGWSDADLLGQTPPFPFWSEESREDIEGAFHRMFDGAVADQSCEVRLRRRSGERFDALIVIAPLQDAAGSVTGWLASFTDITSRKRLEAEFQQAQKLEAVGRLAGGIAHDFNNLLTAILGYSELLGEALGASSLMDDVNEIQKAAASASRLTRQLLAFSRKQIVAPAVVELNSVVDHVEKMLARVIGEDVTLDLQLEAKRSHARCDVGQIEQVLLNLAINARDAMPTGGRLTIATRNDGCRDGVSADPRNFVVLSVRDTGCGMDEDTKAHMFEPFFTTKEVGKGTGLGLASVYTIVQQNGGFVSVDSAPGRGTVFDVYLPLAAQASAADRESPGSASPAAGGGETVLIVEDDPMVRALTSRILARAGYRVVAGSPTGPGFASVGPERIDLLLTDVVMPEANGLQVAARVREGHPDVRVLFMSGYTEHPALFRQVIDHPASFIHKPFGAEALIAKVRALLDAPAVPLSATGATGSLTRES